MTSGAVAPLQLNRQISERRGRAEGLNFSPELQLATAFCSQRKLKQKIVYGLTRPAEAHSNQLQQVSRLGNGGRTVADTDCFSLCSMDLMDIIISFMNVPSLDSPLCPTLPCLIFLARFSSSDTPWRRPRPSGSGTLPRCRPTWAACARSWGSGGTRPPSTRRRSAGCRRLSRSSSSSRRVRASCRVSAGRPTVGLLTSAPKCG